MCVCGGVSVCNASTVHLCSYIIRSILYISCILYSIVLLFDWSHTSISITLQSDFHSVNLNALMKLKI